jgi:hypothetical protein
MPGDSPSTAERMRAGGNSEEVVMRPDEGGEVVQPVVSQRSGDQEPGVEEAVLEGIIFIPER